MKASNLLFHKLTYNFPRWTTSRLMRLEAPRAILAMTIVSFHLENMTARQTLLGAQVILTCKSNKIWLQCCCYTGRWHVVSTPYAQPVQHSVGRSRLFCPTKQPIHFPAGTRFGILKTTWYREREKKERRRKFRPVVG